MRHAALLAGAALLLCGSAFAETVIDAAGNPTFVAPGGDDYAGVTASDVTAVVNAMGRRSAPAGGDPNNPRATDPVNGEKGGAGGGGHHWIPPRIGGSGGAP